MGIIDELEEPIKINLKTSFGFFSNGMGSYIAIDYENCKNNNATFGQLRVSLNIMFTFGIL